MLEISEKCGLDFYSAQFREGFPLFRTIALYIKLQWVWIHLQGTLSFHNSPVRVPAQKGTTVAIVGEMGLSEAAHSLQMRQPFQIVR